MAEQQESAPPAGEAMAACAMEARELARTKFGVELDGSFGSIERLEGILAVQYAAIPRGVVRWFRKGPDEATLRRFAFVWGGYIGEVLRERHGGVWRIPEDGELAGAMCLDVRGTVFSPTTWVETRLRAGAAESVWRHALLMDRELEAQGRAG